MRWFLCPLPSPVVWCSFGCNAAPVHLWWACGAVLSPFLQHTKSKQPGVRTTLPWVTQAVKTFLWWSWTHCTDKLIPTVPPFIWRLLLQITIPYFNVKCNIQNWKKKVTQRLLVIIFKIKTMYFAISSNHFASIYLLFFYGARTDYDKWIKWQQL